MKTLSIDLSHKQILIGLQHQEQFKILIDQNLDKAELLPYLLKESLKTHEIEIRSIHKLGIITGPGNYTSLRAGVLLAKSLAMLNGTQIFSKNRLEVMLYLAAKKYPGDVIAVQNVRQNQYYTAIGKYHKDQILYTHKPECLDEAVLKTLIQNNPADIWGDWPGNEVKAQNNSSNIVMALADWASHSPLNTPPNELVPFYIRPAVTIK